MRKYFVCLLGLVMVLGFVGLSSAAIVTDATGDTIGTGLTDIRAARAEQLTRGDGIVVLKVSYTASPNIGGIMVFESDVDTNTTTGGALSMLGIPVAPCPYKTVPGIDVTLMMMNRDQAASSNSAMCAGCSGTAVVPCARKRYYGEWYAVVAGIGVTDTTGFLRGFTDPTFYTTSGPSKSYTFPWDVILLRANAELASLGFPAERFDYAVGINPATTRWQLSVWTDPNYVPGANMDDFADGLTYFNVSDVIPNAGLIPSVDVGDPLTFCEGNFDGDADQDSSDAAKFKTDLGRSGMKNPCPSSGQYY